MGKIQPISLTAAVQRAEQANTTIGKRQGLKAALLLIWDQLPLEDRRAFKDRLMTPSLDFLKFKPNRGDAAISNAVWHVPAMIEAHEGKERDFLLSIKRQSRRASWKPSDAQRKWLMQLFLEWKADIESLVDGVIDDGDLQLIGEENETR